MVIVQEKKIVANRLYQSIIVVVILTALAMIAYGVANKELVFLNKPEKENSVPQNELAP